MAIVVKLSCNKFNPPIGALLTAEYVKPEVQVEVSWCDSTLLQVDGHSFTSGVAISRYLVRLVPTKTLYGQTNLQKTEVDHWLTFTLTNLGCKTGYQNAVKYLDTVLARVTYLVGHTVSLADLAVWGTLHTNNYWQQSLRDDSAVTVTPNVYRWYKFLSCQEHFVTMSKRLRGEFANETAPENKSKTPAKEGKYVDLPGAEKGKVVVRFPPEASGYLHIGHAKAALLNQHYQLAFDGKLVMRFDDTNPEKEKADFEKVILEDVALLQIRPDMMTCTSDHFDLLFKKCEELLKTGKAYVDDTEPEQMKTEREQRIESANRNNLVEKNLKMWDEMKKGTDLGLKCCVRAKIDMNSNNGCLRDPTLYRCKSEAHPRTGNKYKVYPTYDFACPIVDSIEGITHALRTTEYHDRDEQFYWVLDALGMRKPIIYSYSRLNMMNTVLSKRKLTYFVSEGVVDGWDDPRMPTVRGVLRRGMTVEGLKQFIIAQGSSRSVVVMDWDKIWAFNKKVIDPVAPRYSAVEKHDAVLVLVRGAREAAVQVQKHPKNPEVGTRTVWLGPRVLIDYADAKMLKEGENVTFINWGNLIIRSIKKDKAGKILEVEAETNLENKDYKKTQKITWLADTDKAPPIPCVCLYYNHIISKPILSKEEDFKSYIAQHTMAEVHMLGDPEMTHLKKSDIIQLQRKGYFICDYPHDPTTARYIGRESPLILISIPDGSKDTTTLPEPVKKLWGGGESMKEAAQSAKGKAAEKSPQEEVVGTVSTNWELDRQIKEQGDKIRNLKLAKAAKETVDAEVKVLLTLKAQFKSATGMDWKPGIAIVSDNKEAESTTALDGKIKQQGEKIRKMKSDKVGKDVLDPEIKHLLQLKASYKTLTGNEWSLQGEGSGNTKGSGDVIKENKKKGSPEKLVPAATDALTLKNQIEEQGNKVRSLKASGATKAETHAEVQKLLVLKTKYKDLTGEDLIQSTPGTKIVKRSDSASPSKAKAETKKALPPPKEKKCEQMVTPKAETDKPGLKKVTRLGLEARKEENLAEWYTQVITKAEMIEYYDVSGCYILRPWAYSIWEKIQEYFDAKIKAIGVQNCYFPMFVSSHALEKEKTHVADFAPEVAWVTKSGDTELAEPIALRPTSETVMYPSYAKWIKSHRDLPLQLNQWCNVVRWEFKHPQPFLRTREFLWQEGHSAFATREEAEKEVYLILDMYAEIYEKLLAIPVIKGRKTEKEKFAGGDFTTTVEAFVLASGRGIQGATSHHLGQNFSKMFEIMFEDPETKEKEYVHQNSWGISTRTIGGVVMIHSDNMGLVLPPRIVCYQVVVIPCGVTVSLTEEEERNLIKNCRELERKIVAAGVRCKGDYRDNYSPGWKFNHWELKGVPLRVELGPRDIAKNQFVAVRRDTGEKMTLRMESAIERITDLLEVIQNNLYQRASRDLQEHLKVSHNWNEFCQLLDKRCIIQAPFCGSIPCEDSIKKDSAKDESQQVEPGAPAMGAKSLCIPFKQPNPITSGTKCIHPSCPNKPKFYTLFGRSY